MCALLLFCYALVICELLEEVEFKDEISDNSCKFSKEKGVPNDIDEVEESPVIMCIACELIVH